jgi:sigma-54-interacting transcriptional regulator
MRPLQSREVRLMDDQLKPFTDVAQAASNSKSHSREDWRRARAAHVGLMLVGMRRVNLLLVGIDGMTWNVLQTLMPGLTEPVTTWCPGERLVLPTLERTGTLVLHDVGVMQHADQFRLLKWLEQAGGQTQVISMTSVPLLPRVESGAFHDTLYYRLNTICVDVMSAESHRPA